MDINQATDFYLANFKGFNLESGVPSLEKQQIAMQTVIELAKQSEPVGGKLGHLDEIVGITAALAPKSAELFNKAIVDNPEQKDLAKSLELALSIVEKRSPQTWQHIKNHTALTMLHYENQSNTNAEPNVAQTLTLMTGALGHDIGKIGIDPELLHKDSRIAKDRFAAAVDTFAKSTPNYPEKLHDIVFLEEANLGRILFAEPGQAQAAAANISDLGKDMRRSEEYWVSDAARQNHNAIWDRINAQASASIPKESGAWLNEEERKTLTMPVRGTVTAKEMAVIASHDGMSEELMKALPLPPEMVGARLIVSQDRYREDGSQPHKDAPLLSDVIHTGDVFESITGNRSYRAPYTVEEAIKVMDGMAKEGKINPAVLQSFKDTGTFNDYAIAAGLKHSDDLKPVAQAQVNATASEKSWVDRTGAQAPTAEQNWATLVEMNKQQSNQAQRA